MKVYVIADIRVHDEEMYAEYKRRTPEIVEKYGGRYIVRGSPTVVVGGWSPERLVILEFSSPERLQAFASSPEYQRALEFREKSSSSNTVVIEGCSV